MVPEIYSHTDREIQIDRQIDRQTDRQTDRHTNALITTPLSYCGRVTMSLDQMSNNFIYNKLKTNSSKLNCF